MSLTNEEIKKEMTEWETKRQEALSNKPKGHEIDKESSWPFDYNLHYSTREARKLSPGERRALKKKHLYIPRGSRLHVDEVDGALRFVYPIHGGLSTTERVKQEISDTLEAFWEARDINPTRRRK